MKQPRKRPERLLARVVDLGGTRLDKKLRAAGNTLRDAERSIDRVEGLYVRVIEKFEGELEKLQAKKDMAMREIERLEVLKELEEGE